jgi:hypothetical protein
MMGGDANEDDIINILDLSLIGSSYGSNPGDPSWNPQADINNDGTINIQDIVLSGSNYLKISPTPWP